MRYFERDWYLEREFDPFFNSFIGDSVSTTTHTVSSKVSCQDPGPADSEFH